MTNYDNWLTTEQEDTKYCTVHDFYYAMLCPHCVDEYADRQYDTEKEGKGASTQ